MATDTLVVLHPKVLAITSAISSAHFPSDRLIFRQNIYLNMWHVSLPQKLEVEILFILVHRDWADACTQNSTAPHSLSSVIKGTSVFPSSVSEYSVFGGTTGNTSRWIS